MLHRSSQYRGWVTQKISTSFCSTIYSAAYPGHGSSSLSMDAQTSISPATSSSSFRRHWGVPKSDIQTLQYVWVCPGISSQLDMPQTPHQRGGILVRCWTASIGSFWSGGEVAPHWTALEWTCIRLWGWACKPFRGADFGHSYPQSFSHSLQLVAVGDVSNVDQTEGQQLQWALASWYFHLSQDFKYLKYKTIWNAYADSRLQVSLQTSDQIFRFPAFY